MWGCKIGSELLHAISIIISSCFKLLQQCLEESGRPRWVVERSKEAVALVHSCWKCMDQLLNNRTSIAVVTGADQVLQAGLAICIPFG